MFANKFSIDEVNVPTPLPFEVSISLIVGFWFVLQQTPLEVMSAPPSLVITPPVVAVVCVISVTAVVSTVGNTGSGLHPTNNAQTNAIKNKCFFMNLNFIK